MAPARRHTEISEIPSTVFWTCRSRAVDLLGTLDRCDFDLSLKESLPSLVEVPIIGILKAHQTGFVTWSQQRQTLDGRPSR